METIRIFKNYGCLTAEKRAVYTYGNPQPTATCSDIITARIPKGWEAYEGQSGEMLLTAPWGENYSVNQVLCGDKSPCFSAYVDGHEKQVMLEVIP